METFVLSPVGYVKSNYSHYSDVFRRHSKKAWTKDISRIMLYPGHAAKLKGLEGYSHIIILYWIHKSGEWRMPKGHGKPPHVKLFATRMPVRPNPIALSVVDLMDFSPEKGEIIVKGLDALDKSPVLDIKPYLPGFDSFPEATVPEWVKRHLEKYHHHNDQDE